MRAQRGPPQPAQRALAAITAILLTVARLVVPDVRVRASFRAALQEAGSEHGERCSTDAGFARYIADLLGAERVAPRPGLVTQTTWWWVEGPHERPEYLGRIALRHELTDALRRLGGHIGYDVRRSRRREGHATAMLAAVLPLAHERGIDPALITCDVGNRASRAVIERNGGILDDELDGTLRFWVPTC
jgi:predicted acetyltransferase